MTTEEWLAHVAASRPPLTQEQIAILRPIWQPAVRRLQMAKRDHETERTEQAAGD